MHLPLSKKIKQWFIGQPSEMKGVFEEKAQKHSSPLFIGREKDCLFLRSKWRKVLHDQEGQICLLTGSSGIGKSFLVEKFLLTCAKEKKTIIRAKAKECTSGFQILLKQLTSFWQTEKESNSSLSPGVTRNPLLRTEGQIEFQKSSDSWGERDFFPCQQEEAFYQVKRTFEAMAQKQPVILFFDNVDHLDSITWSCLLFLTKTIAKNPIFLILVGPNNSLSSPQKIYQEQLLSRPFFHHWGVLPFSRTVVRSYLNQNFPNNSFSSEFFLIFFQWTKGNPLSCQELAQWLFEKDLLFFRKKQWFYQNSEKISWPKNLDELIRDRVDSFYDKNRSLAHALSLASVQGKFFYIPLIASLWKKLFPHKPLFFSPNPFLEKFPENEKKANLLFGINSSFCSFRRSIYLSYFYNSLPSAQAKTMHRYYAETLEKNLYLNLQSCALHFQAAEVYPKAAYYNFLLAKEKYRQGYHQDAVTFCQKGLQCFISCSHLLRKETRLWINLTLLYICLELESSKKSQQMLEEALAVAQEQKLTTRLPHILYHLAQIEIQSGQKKKAVLHLREVLSCPSLATGYKIRALYQLGKIYSEQEKWHLAEQKLRQSLELGKEKPSVFLIQVLEVLREVLFLQGKGKFVIQDYLEVQQIFQENSLFLEEGECLFSLAQFYENQDNYVSSFEKYKEAQKIFQKAHNKMWEHMVEEGLGRIYALQKKRKEALLAFEKTRGFWQEMQNSLSQASSLNAQGILWRQSQDFTKAEEKHQQALKIYQEQSHKPGQVISWRNLALVFLEKKNSPEAYIALEKAFAIQKKDNPKKISLIWESFAFYYLKQNQWEEALSYLQKKLKSYKSCHTAIYEAKTLEYLSWVNYDRGESSKAKNFCESSLEIREKLGLTASTARNYVLLAQIGLDCGQLQQAEKYFQRSLKINQKEGQVLGEAKVLIKLGSFYASLWQLDKAEKSLKKAQSLAKRYKSGRDLNHCYQQMARVFRKRKQYEKSREWLEKASELPNPHLVKACSFFECGWLFYLHENYDEADSQFSKALISYKKNGNLRGEAKIYHCQGLILLQKNRILEAMEKLSLSFSMKEKLKDTRGLAYTYMGIGQAYIALNRLDKSLENFSKAFAHWKKLCCFPYMAKCLYHLGKLYVQEGQPEKAQEAFSEALDYYKNTDRTLAEEITSYLEELEP